MRQSCDLTKLFNLELSPDMVNAKLLTWYSKGKVADGPEGLLHSARVYKGSMCAVYCVVTSESVK